MLPGQLLGLFYGVLGLAFFAVSWRVGVTFRASTAPLATLSCFLQAALVVLSLPVVALILFFQGGRLDPILMFANYLLFLVMFSVFLKDSLLLLRR